MSVDIDVLERVPLFAALHYDERARIAALAEDVSVASGTPICQGKDFAYHFYAILEGSADVTQDETTLATLGPGDFFGEIGLLVTGRRSASVVAREPTRLVALFDQHFRRLEAEIPEFSAPLRAAVGDRGWSATPVSLGH